MCPHAPAAEGVPPIHAGQAQHRHLALVQQQLPAGWAGGESQLKHCAEMMQEGPQFHALKNTPAAVCPARCTMVCSARSSHNTIAVGPTSPAASTPEQQRVQAVQQRHDELAVQQGQVGSWRRRRAVLLPQHALYTPQGHHPALHRLLLHREPVVHMRATQAAPGGTRETSPAASLHASHALAPNC